ncbi:hypothetical protein UCRPC4_g05771 [Phaeomoniella chlamydospora]|uniref:Uncharacterized protein n=1 Tax=Phaeomoniella chlamydospora TaxID=158046 RepID=A0A0G2E239_PHACM|nr:hypothetical protein UCRPC4_g05771 [Phaeomoniella chlamydospora]
MYPYLQMNNFPAEIQEALRTGRGLRPEIVEFMRNLGRAGKPGRLQPDQHHVPHPLPPHHAAEGQFQTHPAFSQGDEHFQLLNPYAQWHYTTKNNILILPPGSTAPNGTANGTSFGTSNGASNGTTHGKLNGTSYRSSTGATNGLSQGPWQSGTSNGSFGAHGSYGARHGAANSTTNGPYATTNSASYGTNGISYATASRGTSPGTLMGDDPFMGADAGDNPWEAPDLPREARQEGNPAPQPAADEPQTLATEILDPHLNPHLAGFYPVHTTHRSVNPYGEGPSTHIYHVTGPINPNDLPINRPLVPDRMIQYPYHGPPLSPQEVVPIPSNPLEVKKPSQPTSVAAAAATTTSNLKRPRRCRTNHQQATVASDPEEDDYDEDETVESLNAEHVSRNHARRERENRNWDERRNRLVAAERREREERERRIREEEDLEEKFLDLDGNAGAGVGEVVREMEYNKVVDRAGGSSGPVVPAAEAIGGGAEEQKKKKKKEERGILGGDSDAEGELEEGF